MHIYVEGPGDIVAMHQQYRVQPNWHDVHTAAFSTQVFDVCAHRDEALLGISTCTRAAYFSHRSITSRNIPCNRSNCTGIRYHAAGVKFAFSVFWLSLRSRTNTILISTGTIPWYLIWIFRLTCQRIICIHHNTLWPVFAKPTGFFANLILKLDIFSLKISSDTHLVVSQRITRQLMDLGIAKPAAITRFTPLFNPEIFSKPIHKAVREDWPLQLMFSGRIELNKGVLDLLKAVQQVTTRSTIKIHLVMAGTGSFEAQARAYCETNGLSEIVDFVGQISGTAMQKYYATADLLIAPTQRSFSEGYAMVVPEAILAGTGVIATYVVPAADDFPDCVHTVVPDNPGALADAIMLLAHNRKYLKLHDGCHTYRDRILDESASLRSTIRNLLNASHS
jgi:glycosyltransferase involved in cell wall biosynthesis